MKLLIISGFHYDYGLTVAKAFEDLGHEVKYCGYSLGNNGFKGLLRYSIMETRTNQVCFAGWVPYDRTENFYIQNDIQVISSINEGLPRSIVEGASRGLPLVSTNAGGCADFLTHEKNALLVSSGNPSELASAIERVINEKKLRRKLIKEGYELAHSATFEVMGKQFLDDIREVACKN